jgi:hypothetical protein
MARSQAERHLAAIVGANAKWARTQNRTAATQPGRDAINQRFLDEAGGDAKRAANLRKEHFARLALKSVAARRKAKEQTELAEAAEQELRDAGGEA